MNMIATLPWDIHFVPYLLKPRMEWPWAIPSYIWLLVIALSVCVCVHACNTTLKPKSMIKQHILPQDHEVHCVIYSHHQIDAIKKIKTTFTH